jgi:hypothetical protein
VGVLWGRDWIHVGLALFIVAGLNVGPHGGRLNPDNSLAGLDGLATWDVVRARRPSQGSGLIRSAVVGAVILGARPAGRRHPSSEDDGAHDDE